MALLTRMSTVPYASRVRGHAAVDVLVDRHIGPDGQCLASLVGDLPLHRFHLGQGAADQRHPGAGGRQRGGDPSPDPLAGPGDDGHLAFELRRRHAHQNPMTRPTTGGMSRNDRRPGSAAQTVGMALTTRVAVAIRPPSLPSSSVSFNSQSIWGQPAMWIW